MRPDRCVRSVGRTARSTLRMPKTLVSKTARAAESLASSTADNKPRPALLTTTSTRPNRCTAASTAAAASASSSTSSATGRQLVIGVGEPGRDGTGVAGGRDD